MTDVFKLIEANGLTLHGDIEHFAELVRAEAREAMVAETLAHDDADAIIIQYHEATIKILEKRIEELTAQPEQEPDDAIELFEYWNAVEGWVKIDEVRKHFGSVGCGTIYKTAGEDRVPLYTTPPQRPWVGLTDEEMREAVRPLCDSNEVAKWLLEVSTDEYRAIEAKLKEKNT